MSLESLNTLESRIGRVVELVQQLRGENETLRTELHSARERIREQEDHRQEWEIERTDMGGRIDRVLAELDGIEAIADTSETSELGASSGRAGR